MTDREELARLIEPLLSRRGVRKMASLGIAEHILAAGWRRCAVGQGVTQHCPEAERLRKALKQG